MTHLKNPTRRRGERNERGKKFRRLEEEQREMEEGINTRGGEGSVKKAPDCVGGHMRANGSGLSAC